MFSTKAQRINQKFDQMLMPTAIFSQILGLPGHHAKLGRPSNIAILYSFILCIFYTWFRYETLTIQREENSDFFNQNNFFSKISAATQIYINTLNIYVIAVLHYIHFKRVNNFLMKLKQLDQQLLTKFQKQVTGSLNYDQTRSKTVYAYLAMQVFIFLSALITNYNKDFTFAGLRTAVIDVINFQYTTVMTFQFVFYSYLVKQRYETCNNLLFEYCFKNNVRPSGKYRKKIYVKEMAKFQKQYHNEKSAKMLGFHSYLPYNYYQICDDVFEVHDQCYELFKDVNYSFGLQILLTLAVLFITLLIVCYRISKSVTAILTYKIYLASTLVLVVVQLISMVKISTDTSDEANYTKIILHRARNSIMELKQSVSIFTCMVF